MYLLGLSENQDASGHLIAKFGCRLENCCATMS